MTARLAVHFLFRKHSPMPEGSPVQDPTPLLENALVYISSADRLLQRAAAELDAGNLPRAALSRSYKHVLNSLDRLQSLHASLRQVAGVLGPSLEFADDDGGVAA